jgi:hypothetical protein
LRITVAAILFIFSTSASFGMDFRNTSWQMSRGDVIASEIGRPISETNVANQQEIVYTIFINDVAGKITYLLKNDRLLSASYSFKNDQSMQVFNIMNKELINKYGKPNFQSGKLVVWRLEKTEIALTHLPDNTCYVAYWEKAYFAQTNQMSEALK